MTDSGQFAALEGKRWQSATLPDGSRPTPGMDVWWEIKDTTLLASTGCAGMSGTADVVSNRLIVGEMAAPAISCGTIVDQQAGDWREWLQSGPEILVDLGASPPEVVMDDGSHRMTFTPQPPAAIRSDTVPTG